MKGYHKEMKTTLPVKLNGPKYILSVCGYDPCLQEKQWVDFIDCKRGSNPFTTSKASHTVCCRCYMLYSN